MKLSLVENTCYSILPDQGEVFFYQSLFSTTESDTYRDKLLQEITWKQEPIKIFGKEIMQPRLTAWYGESDKPYTYSGLTMQPQKWTKTLRAIKERIETVAGVSFTSALLNLYRDGQDSMGWHRDNEKELGFCPVIGSVSFGATRIFQFRKYKSKNVKISVDLSAGSFLLMRGETNHYWEHQVAKTRNPVKERINITFRIIN